MEFRIHFVELENYEASFSNENEILIKNNYRSSDTQQSQA